MFLALVASCLAACTALSTRQEPCPLHASAGVDLVHGRYFVQLQTGHSLDDHFLFIGQNLSLQAGFDRFDGINVYVAEIDPATLHSRVRYDPGVTSVEQDHYLPNDDNWRQDEIVLKHETRGSEAALATSSLSQRGLGNQERKTTAIGPRWLAQISSGQKMPQMNSMMLWDSFEGAGSGVDIYIIDSGVRLDHDLFAGRAINFYKSNYTGGPADDFDGHGTHVASIAASVAPYATIINVKIACNRVNDPADREPNCTNGTSSSLVRALNDITDVHLRNRRGTPNSAWRGSVINISSAFFLKQGLPAAQALNFAIQYATDSGIPIAAAAGNTNTSNVASPCLNKRVMCVAGIDSQYKRSEFSNYGKYVNIFAPSNEILGAGINSKNERVYKRGTSQASPMVAGTMAIFVGFETLNDNVAAVYDRLRTNALRNELDVKDPTNATPNVFLQTGINNHFKEQFYLWTPYFGVDFGRLADRAKSASDTGDVKQEQNCQAPQDPSKPVASSDPDTVPGNPVGDCNEILATATTYGAAPGYKAIFTAVPSNSSEPPEVVVALTASFIDVPESTPGPDSTPPPLVLLTTFPIPTPTTSPPFCKGNQVAGDCRGATLPSATPYSGRQGPSCNKADGDVGTAPRLNVDKVKSAVFDYCQKLASAGIKLGNIPGASAPKGGNYLGQAENGGNMFVDVTWMESACPTDHSISSVDFAAMGAQKCAENLFTTLDEWCVQDSTWMKYNPDFTWEGGIFGDNCVLWSVIGST